MAEPIMPAVSYMDTLAEGNITADGTEQTIVEASGSENPWHQLTPFTLNAWVDLSNMEPGDTIIMRQYIRLKEGGNWIKYGEESYSGIQSSPALFIVTKPAKYGVKITLEQSVGAPKSLEYNVFRQRSAIDRGSIVFP